MAWGYPTLNKMIGKGPPKHLKLKRAQRALQVAEGLQLFYFFILNFDGENVMKDEEEKQSLLSILAACRLIINVFSQICTNFLLLFFLLCKG